MPNRYSRDPRFDPDHKRRIYNKFHNEVMYHDMLYLTEAGVDAIDNYISKTDLRDDKKGLFRNTSTWMDIIRTMPMTRAEYVDQTNSVYNEGITTQDHHEAENYLAQLYSSDYVSKDYYIPNQYPGYDIGLPEAETLRTGYEWMQYHIDHPSSPGELSIIVADADGFGERKAGVPSLTDKMTEKQYWEGVSSSSIRPYKPERHDPWLNEKIHGIKPEPMPDAERIRLNEEINRLGEELRQLDEERRRRRGEG